MRTVARLLTVAALALALGSTALAAPPVGGPYGTSSTAPLGSTRFYPSADHPIGWRGDGTGRYLGATPPTTWSRKQNGAGYAVSGILWAAPLPNIGVSSPIIVGDGIFVTTEVADLVCLDKQTGRVLWIRSNLEFEGLSDAERIDSNTGKTNPIYAETLTPLAQKLAQANDAAVADLNAQLGAAATSGRRPVGMDRKRAIEKQIQDQQLGIDKKKFERYWGQGMFGFAGQTPVSDGKRVYVFFTTGVSACYDLEGKRLWIHRGSGGGSEHGNFASPVLAANRFVVWAQEMRGYDAETGKLAWTVPAKSYNTYGSLFRFQSGGEWVAAFQWGYFVRVRDGQAIWDSGLFGDSVATPIVEGDTIFAHMGYPKNGDESKGFRAFQIPASTEDGKLKQLGLLKTEWGADEVTGKFERGYCASPLFLDGLIYQLSEGGGLIVNDASTGEVVYHKVLPMHPHTEYWGWAGAGASPTAAGKYIYLIDNQGTMIVIQPGRQYKMVAQNTLEESGDGKSQAQLLANPVFEGARMYYRTPGYLYCIGGK